MFYGRSSCRCLLVCGLIDLTVGMAKRLDRGMEFGCGGNITCGNGDLVRLLERSQGWPVGSVDACQLKGPATVVAASGIKLRAVIRESKQMPIEQKFKPGASSLHLDFGVVVFALRRQHIAKAPIHLQIADRNHSPEQCLRLAEVAVR